MSQALVSRSSKAFARGWRAAACLAALAFAPAATVIPQSSTSPDPTGVSAVFLSGGPVDQSTNQFFLPVAGGNGRSCATCHQPTMAYSFTPAYAQQLFNASSGLSSLFRIVDGAGCETDDVSTVAARQLAYSPVLTKGLIRIASNVPGPPNLQYTILSFTDPYGCIGTFQFGLRVWGPGVVTQGVVSQYRRPLPAVNLAFISSVLDDGRVPNLLTQATNATLGHMQSPVTPTPALMAQVTAFEIGVFGAQLSDTVAGMLNANGASGGPQPIVALPFYSGINDPFGADPTGKKFNPVVFNDFNKWATAAPGSPQAAIYAGQKIFNTRKFNITGVAGLNDVENQPTINGTCSTCHNTPNIGSHSLPFFMNEGLDAVSLPGGLDATALPSYTILCNTGPLAGQTIVTTDPGRGSFTGACQDIGKFKVFSLRDLAARPPFFHNGSAATLTDVVNFYNARFNIGLSATEQANLAAFLGAL